MKDKLLFQANVTGISACMGIFPENTVFDIVDTDDVKNAVALTNNSNIYGYITGNTACLIKTMSENGHTVYALKSSDNKADIYLVRQKI